MHFLCLKKMLWWFYRTMWWLCTGQPRRTAQPLFSCLVSHLFCPDLAPIVVSSYLLFDRGQDGGGGLCFRSVSIGGWHHRGNHSPLLLLHGLLRYRHHYCQHKDARKNKIRNQAAKVAIFIYFYFFWDKIIAIMSFSKKHKKKKNTKNIVGMEAVMDVSGWVSGWVPQGFVGEKNNFCCGCVTEQGASEGFERICSQERLWERKQAGEFWMFLVSKIAFKKGTILDSGWNQNVDNRSAEEETDHLFKIRKKKNKLERQSWWVHGLTVFKITMLKNITLERRCYVNVG